MSLTDIHPPRVAPYRVVAGSRVYVVETLLQAEGFALAEALLLHHAAVIDDATGETLFTTAPTDR